VLEQLAPCSGQPDAARPPFEQADAELDLELEDAAGERGLRDPEVVGRVCDAAAVGDLHKTLHGPDVHSAASHARRAWR
jgi:hypothetical protein